MLEAIYWSRVRRFLSSYAAHRTWEVGQNKDDLKILEWLFGTKGR